METLRVVIGDQVVARGERAVVDSGTTLVLLQKRQFK